MTDAPPRRVALFGGTFDPPHLGHMAIAREAIRACDLDRIFFIPCRQSPHKSDTAAASGPQRTAMLQIAVGGTPWAEVSTDELEHGGVSYSYQTAQRFRGRLPQGGALHWILGADQWNALHRWSRPDVLAELLTFIVLPRAGLPLNPRPGFRSVFLQLTHPASATKIRQELWAGHPSPAHLDPAVLAYIREHGLYLPESPGS
ncbi:nicotinate-nucleotide adenylyltransferase [soil metagenome]